MNKVIVIGCSGSGKSTLARSLGDLTKLPVVHLDRLWWQPGWETVSREEFDALHSAALEEPSWIIDGNFSRTLPQRLEKCDTVIYLDFDRATCVFGVLKRVITNLGKVRPDMGEGCPERFSWEFLRWVWDFNKNNREKTYRLLSEAKNVRVYILKNRHEVSKFLADIGQRYCNKSEKMV